MQISFPFFSLGLTIPATITRMSPAGEFAHDEKTLNVCDADRAETRGSEKNEYGIILPKKLSAILPIDLRESA